MASLAANIFKKVGDSIGSGQERLVKPGLVTDYLLLFALALAPILLSRLFGMARSTEFDLITKAGTQRVACKGYWDRSNWTTLVILLPAALFVLRLSTDRLFRLTGKTASYAVVPDLTVKQDPTRFRAALFDSRNFLAVFTVTVLIHLVDLKWQAYYFWYGRQPSWVLPSVPTPIWDWTAWFLSRPGDHRLFWENLCLVVVAYTSQFLLVLIALSLIAVILRHNLFFLESIYLRSRPGSTDQDSFIVLDFDNPDRSFGMRRLNKRFNFQILLLSFAGVFTLVSRFANAQTGPLETFISRLKLEQLSSLDKFVLSLPPGLLPVLFPTAGQKMFAGVWLLMFLIVLLPARAKLLPIHYNRKTDAQQYLLEFIPPGSAIDHATNSLKTDEDVTRNAKKFASNAFWPAGNSQAEFLSIGAFFVFFFILGPVAPRSLAYLLYYACLLVAAYTCSKILFWYFRYRLYSVDERLVSGKNNGE